MLLRDKDFPVSEIFESIQGEGNCAGVNSLFVRFQLCNLTCTWCDTKYTWTQFSDKFSIKTLNELKSILKDAKPPNIILTGGEPSLFRLDLLNTDEKQLHVETNGTIIPTHKLDMVMRDGSHIQRDGMDEEIISKFNWIISPKLSNSKQEIFEESMEYWVNKTYATFKFIVNSESDIGEVSDFCKRYNLPNGNSYLGLQGNTVESQMRKDLVEIIIRKGFNFSPRLHVLLWGKERAK